MRKYQEKKKCKSSGSNYGLIQANPGNGEEDPALLWSTARGSSDDYAGIWSSFLDQCSARVSDEPFINGHGISLPRCLRGGFP